MTMGLRRDIVTLMALVLIQGAVLAWVGSILDPLLAVGSVVCATASIALFPTLFAQTRAYLRAMATAIRWWHVLWALLFCSDFVFRVRDVQSIQDNPLDAWALYRVALVGLAGSVLLWRLAIGRGQWLRSLLSGNLLVMAFFPLAGVISTLWSVYPSWTAYKSVELLIDIAVLSAAVATAATSENFKDLFDWTWLLLLLVQASVWIGAAAAPQIAFIPVKALFRLQLTGVLPNISANGVGHIAAILAIVAMSRILRGRSGSITYWMILATSLATLFLAQTRSALIGFVAGAALVLIASRRAIIALGVVFAVALIFAFTSFDSMVWEYVRRGQDAQLFSSFSGRTNWWSFAWERFREHPITGYGAFAGGRFAALAEMGDQETSSLHNTYLEAVLGLGVVGLVPLLACLFSTWWQLLRTLASRAASTLTRNMTIEAAGVMTVITVRSFFTTDLIWHPALPWFLVLGYTTLLRREQRRVNS